MPHAIERQTAPGVRSTNHEITTQDQHPPIFGRLFGFVQQWQQTRTGRSRRGLQPIPKMPTPTKLALQHSTQIGIGIVPTYQAVNPQGDSFTNSANAVLQVFNNTGQPFLVTVVAQSPCQQGYFHNYQMYVQNGQNLPTIIGPFDFHYNDGSNLVHVYYTWGVGIVSGATIALVAP